MDTLPGPFLVSAEQLKALPVKSIVEIVGTSWDDAVFRKGSNAWYGTNGKTYSVPLFPIGNTYLVRSGPLQ
jgi:hypothetical protein